MNNTPNIISVSVTNQGHAMAEMLPYRHLHGDAGETIRLSWNEVDAIVVFLAVGAVTRIIGPLLNDKTTDPAVVCVDEAGRYAVALVGGHGDALVGGANLLAQEVAVRLGAEAIITTATDATGMVALDTLAGFIAQGDVAGVTTAMLNGEAPTIDNPNSWPLPARLTDQFDNHDPTTSLRIVVTDRAMEPEPGVVILRPSSLVVGIGASSGAPAEDIATLLASTLAETGLVAESISELATVDLKANEPGIVALGLPMRTFSAETLAIIEVPTPSAQVAKAVGTPSVAEAAALLAAGPGAELIVTKQKNATATVAIARRVRPRGHLALVGLGPGSLDHRTPAAAAAVRKAEVVIGYKPYIKLCSDLLNAHHEVLPSPIGDEVIRAKQALAMAGEGKRVAMVCSGDAGVYAMASIVLELAGKETSGIDIEVVPGVTAALAAAAALGAPLGHDHVSISLSDLLTPWEAIEARLHAAADADLVVTLYNPRSRGRDWQLDTARKILLTNRPANTPVGIVTDAARPGQQVHLTTLTDLDVDLVAMTTCVIIGSSTTRIVQGRMVTPRGYRP